MKYSFERLAVRVSYSVRLEKKDRELSEYYSVIFIHIKILGLKKYLSYLFLSASGRLLECDGRSNFVIYGPVIRQGQRFY